MLGLAKYTIDIILYWRPAKWVIWPLRTPIYVDCHKVNVYVALSHTHCHCWLFSRPKFFRLSRIPVPEKFFGREQTGSKSEPVFDSVCLRPWSCYIHLRCCQMISTHTCLLHHFPVLQFPALTICLGYREFSNSAV